MEASLVSASLFIVFILGIGFGYSLLAFINDVAVIRRVLTKKSYSDSVDDFNLLRYSELLYQEQKKQDL